MDKLAASKAIKRLKAIRIDFVNTLGLKVQKPNGELKTTAELDLLEDMINLDMRQIFK